MCCKCIMLEWMSCCLNDISQVGYPVDVLQVHYVRVDVMLFE